MYAVKHPKKGIPFAFLNIMKKYSDESHGITMTQIQNIMEKEYDFAVDRRTGYAYVALLKQYGYDIHSNVGWHISPRGYFLVHSFSPAEAKAMIDAINSADITPETKKKAEKLIRGELSKYQETELDK